MASVTQILRQRTRYNARPHDRRTKSEYADAMRAAAISCLNMPGMHQDGIDNANAMLEMVGDVLTHPRCGWYPNKPKGWRA